MFCGFLHCLPFARAHEFSPHKMQLPAKSAKEAGVRLSMSSSSGSSKTRKILRVCYIFFAEYASVASVSDAGLILRARRFAVLY